MYVNNAMEMVDQTQHGNPLLTLQISKSQKMGLWLEKWENTASRSSLLLGNIELRMISVLQHKNACRSMRFRVSTQKYDEAMRVGRFQHKNMHYHASNLATLAHLVFFQKTRKILQASLESSAQFLRLPPYNACN